MLDAPGLTANLTAPYGDSPSCQDHTLSIQDIRQKVALRARQDIDLGTSSFASRSHAVGAFGVFCFCSS